MHLWIGPSLGFSSFGLQYSHVFPPNPQTSPFLVFEACSSWLLCGPQCGLVSSPNGCGFTQDAQFSSVVLSLLFLGLSILLTCTLSFKVHKSLSFSNADKAFDWGVVGTNPILKGFFARLGVKRKSWTLQWWYRGNTARPHLTSVVSVSIRLLSLHSFCDTVSIEKSDQSIWICESACYEVFGSNLLFQSRFSEAVPCLGLYLLK